MTLGSHQKTIGKSQTHITPRWILSALGKFDLDPCAASPRPYDCARENFTEAEDGLSRTWHGRVWLNPPFDRRVVGEWIERMADHGHGTALVHARTETGWFKPIWDYADALLFVKGRVVFCKTDGNPQTTLDGKVANSGAPVVLVAFGREDVERLRWSNIPGALVDGWQPEWWGLQKLKDELRPLYSFNPEHHEDEELRREVISQTWEQPK